MFSTVVLLTSVHLTTTSHVRAENEIIQGGTKRTQSLWWIIFNKVLYKNFENTQSIDVTPCFTVTGKFKASENVKTCKKLTIKM